ncbi:unnamed protein product [Xylocopa violacea]|uniref:Uncharacterized protein n=1 Tax=Xylocopa violacea TaxID=135666 RepID=A0ABP1PE58_XYLVO
MSELYMSPGRNLHSTDLPLCSRTLRSILGLFSQVYGPSDRKIHRERETPFLRPAARARGRNDERRRAACGSCDGPRHVAHVQVQRELKTREKKEDEEEKRESRVSK